MIVMRIGSFLNNLFHCRNADGADPADPNAHTLALLSARLDASVTTQQIRDLDRGLAAMRELPGGAILLDAMRAYSEATGKQPRIVPTQDRHPPHTQHVSNGTWRVHPRALLDHPHKGLQILALLYEDMARPRDGHFHGVARGRLPQPDAALQTRWQTWATQGTPWEKRIDAMGAMWNWFEETAYYGGLTRDQMIGMLDHIALGEPVPTPLYAELNLSGLHLTELPEMPPAVYALRADDNDLQTLDHLPDDLRILRLNRVFKRHDLPDLSHQLQRLPGGLIELELDGNQLAAIMEAPGMDNWTLPKHLKSLSLSGNALTALPALRGELATLSASDNCLMTIPVPTLAKATGLQKADFSHNFLDSVPAAIRGLPRSCEVDLTGNPLTAIALQIARRRALPFGTAFWQVADEMHRMPGPRIIYNAYEPDAAAAPETEEPPPPSTAAPAELEAEVRAWLGEKRMRAVAQSWRDIAATSGTDYFVRMLRRLRLDSANKVDAGFRQSVAEYLTVLIRPERAALRDITFSTCEERRGRCADHAALLFVQLKILRANDDVALGTYDDSPQELVELGEQLFLLDLLTQEAIANGNRIFKDKRANRQEYVETVLACYVHFREKLGLSLVVPKMDYASYSGLEAADFKAMEAVVEKKRKEFPYFLNVEWEGWKHMLKRNFRDEYQAAETRRYADLDQLQPNITLALQRKGLDPGNESLRDREGFFVNRKMVYERMAPVTRAYLESIGKHPLALHAAPETPPTMDEKLLIGPI
jgi:E3 ubiquitin-protein ligase SspH2